RGGPPAAELTFRVAQGIEQIDRNAATNLSRQRARFITTAKDQKLAVGARLWSAGDVGLLAEDVAEPGDRRIMGCPKICQKRGERHVRREIRNLKMHLNRRAVVGRPA